MKKISIIDYGIGNVLSVQRAFEYWGVPVNLVSTQAEINQSTHLVLPGVGAFKDGMAELDNRGLVDAIREYCSDEKPFLGICLGMQMMLEESDEFGITKGLGLIPGRVTRIEDTNLEGNPHKVPHIGWNELALPANSSPALWKGTLLEDIPHNSDAYFVHSYTAHPTYYRHRLADAYYGGRLISAAIRRGNLYGTQFHPEKSGNIGLQIIRNFIQLEA